MGLPDATIILDLPPEVSLKRKIAHLKTTGENSEKFEKTAFLEIVRKKFLERAKEKKYKVINAENSIDSVQNKIRDYIKNKMNF